MPDPPHPGEMVRESMDELAWNVNETATRLERERGTLSRLLDGRAGRSADMALAREKIGWSNDGRELKRGSENGDSPGIRSAYRTPVRDLRLEYNGNLKSCRDFLGDRLALGDRPKGPALDNPDSRLRPHLCSAASRIVLSPLRNRRLALRAASAT